MADASITGTGSARQYAPCQRWPDGIPESHKTYQCRVCGEDFNPKRAGRTKFCSKTCVGRWLSYRAEIARTSGRVSVIVALAHCTSCGRLHRKRSAPDGTCAPACASRARDPRPCSECGNMFVPTYGNKRRTYCSKSCSRRASNRVSKSARRAKARALPSEPVNPIAVFERDGWKCRLCGIDTPRGLRGTIAANAPELDHIIPVSKDGPHTYENVQCACRKCNNEKGDNYPEQVAA